MSMERGPDTERLWLLNNAVWAVRARLHVGLFSVNILKNFFEICYYLKETQMNPTIFSTFSFLHLPWLEAHSNFYTCCVLCVHRLGYPRGSGQQPRTLQSPRVECASEPRDKGTSLQCSWDIGQESGDANESAQGLWETIKYESVRHLAVRACYANKNEITYRGIHENTGRPPGRQGSAAQGCRRHPGAQLGLGDKCVWGFASSLSGSRFWSFHCIGFILLSLKTAFSHGWKCGFRRL